jgi:hypothetical protein
MRYLRLFGAVLVAACALGAVVLATASALPTILPETITTWSGTNVGEITFSSLNSKSEEETFKCEKAGAEGTLEQPRPLGLYHIHIEGCKGPSSSTCTGLGETGGTILALGSWHLVFDTLKSVLLEAGVAILFLTGKVHFVCTFLTINELVVVLLGGMMLCLILNPTVLTKTFEFHCKKRTSPFGPEETKYYNEGGTLVSIVGLLSAKNEGTEGESVQVWLGAVTYGQDALIMF